MGVFTRAGSRLDSIFGGAQTNPLQGQSATAPVRPDGQQADGWANPLSGMGFGATDPAGSTGYAGPRTMSQHEVVMMYRGEGLAARIVDLPAAEALRQGYEVAFDGDMDFDVKGWAHDIEIGDGEFGLDVALERWIAWHRLFGGAAIVMLTDAPDYKQPLRLGESLEALRVLSRHDLQPVNVIRTHSEPEYWQVTSTSQVFHRSRLVLLGRSRLPAGLRPQGGWDDPLYARVWRALAANGTLDRTSESILHQFITPVQKVTGLAALLATHGPTALMQRMGLQQLTRSMYRVTLVDSDKEDYSIQTTSVAGLGEFMDKFPERLAAVVPMPMTLLMGRSPGGLNATGESDVRFWYDGIKAREQGKYLAPAIRRLLTVAFHSPTGPTQGLVPEKWKVVFNPLWQMSESEIEDIALKRAQRDAIYLDRQVVTPEQVAAARFGQDEGDITL